MRTRSTIDQLLKTAEVNLAVAEEAEDTDLFFDKYIKLSQTTSLLAIARCLNHIVDHGVSPAPPIPPGTHLKTKLELE